MLMQNIYNKIIDQITSSFDDVLAIYIFGSFGTEYEKDDSDIDIAILFHHKIKDINLMDCKNSLEESLKRRVDLIDLRRVYTVFQKEIIFADRRIFCNNEYLVQEFEMLVMSYYQKLNEERREILEEIKKTGRIIE